jgi:hypothetical protein
VCFFVGVGFLKLWWFFWVREFGEGFFFHVFVVMVVEVCGFWNLGLRSFQNSVVWIGCLLGVGCCFLGIVFVCVFVSFQFDSFCCLGGGRDSV